MEIRGNAALARGNPVHLVESRNMTADWRCEGGKRRKNVARFIVFFPVLSQRHNRVTTMNECRPTLTRFAKLSLVSSVQCHTHRQGARWHWGGFHFPPTKNSRSLPSLHPATNTPRRHDLFVSFGPNPTRADRHFARPRGVNSKAPDTATSLPILTPRVTPRPPELHFYSGRHVRARVRLHLRRVTGNNNTEIGEGRESRWRHQAETADSAAETGGKSREETNLNDGR